MGVYELSGAGSIKTGRTLYTSMNAGNQYGAMVPIASYTLDGSSYLNFVNIPQNYQDLRLVVYGRSGNSVTTEAISLYFNAFATGLYSLTSLNGDGSTPTSSRNSNQDTISSLGILPGNSATSGIFGSMTIDILSYANTSVNKTVISRSVSDLNGSGNTRLVIGCWRSTVAITSIATFPAGGSQQFAAGSQATLYGIRAVSS